MTREEAEKEAIQMRLGDLDEEIEQIAKVIGHTCGPEAGCDGLCQDLAHLCEERRALASKIY